MFIDDEEHRSSCESGNYNEEFSSTRNLIKNSETAYLDAEESDQQHEQFTRDQLDSFILNPNRQLNTSEPEYYRDSRVNYENDIDDEFRANETSESSTSSSYDEPDEREDDFDEADSSENSEYYENSDSDDNRSTADSLTSSDDELNDDSQQLASTMQLIRKKSSGHHSTTTNDSQFVGHFDGSKPLLMEDDDYDEEERTKEGKLIDIDDGEENLFETATVQNSISYMPADQQEAAIVSQRATTDLLNQSNRSNLSNFSAEDELDKEVASNLYRQVEQDKLRNKDLFGSKPFNEETREALKCKLNIETSSFNKEKPAGAPVTAENVFTDNQFNKMNIDQIKSMQISSMANSNQPNSTQPPSLISGGQVGDRVDSSTLSAIASTLLENQDKTKKGDKYQSVKLPNVIKKQPTSRPSEQPQSVQLAIENALNSSSGANYEGEMMASPSTLFDHDSNLKVIKSTKSSKLPSSLRHKDEKHQSKTKVKLHKSKLNPSKLKGSQKNYKGIEEYDDDVDELLSNDQDDLSQAANLNHRSSGKDEKSEKKPKKSKESKLGLSISKSKDKDKEKSKDKEREKKDKKHKEKKEEKRLKKESKKSGKSSEKPRGFANMSFEDNIEDKLEEMEETRC